MTYKFAFEKRDCTRIDKLNKLTNAETMCDYNGYFDWDLLNQHGAIEGCIYCDTELEILIACETIRRL